MAAVNISRPGGISELRRVCICGVLKRGEQPPGDPFALNLEVGIAIFAIPPSFLHLLQQPAVLF